MDDLSLGPSATDSVVERATRLFTFLGEVQRIKSDPPRSVDGYESVLWLGDLPDHPAVQVAGRTGVPDRDDPLLSIDRLPNREAPAPDEPLARWLTGAVDIPDAPPTLRETITRTERVEGPDSEVELQTRELKLVDHPEVRRAFDDWLPHWRVWADLERRDRPVREYYRRLFSIYQEAAGYPETYELVLGTGCLAWEPAGHGDVKRHLLTSPVAVKFDDRTGRLTVVVAEALHRVEVELDMLDPRLTASSHFELIGQQARLLDCHPLDRDEIGSIARRLVHSLDSDGEYRDEVAQPERASHAMATLAPAVILRRRTQSGLMNIFRTIVNQIKQAGEVHGGIVPLVDPNYHPEVGRESSDGAVVVVDDEPFLPLPINEKQLQIIHRVDTVAQTLVQGPPGTGKTHTAAALLSHLLAQGKRVLVTAQTDRALKEVRGKLPDELKPLSVSVVGTSQEDMADLKLAVSRIASAAAERDQRRTDETIQSCLIAIDRLRLQRAGLYRRLVDARESEVREHQFHTYRGTLATIAKRIDAERATFGWLREHAPVPPDTQPPLADSEIRQWHRYLADETLRSDEAESQQRLLDPADLPTPETFAGWVAAELAALQADRTHAPQKEEPAFEAIRSLVAAVRHQLQERLHDLAEMADGLARRQEVWIPEALADVLAGRAATWRARADQLSCLIDRAAPLVDRLGELTEVAVTGANIGPLVSLASQLTEYIQGGGKVRVGPDGMPKVGTLTPRLVKQARPLFEQVRVDGLPPVQPEQLTAFVTWTEAIKILTALDRAWPSSVQIPPEDTLRERLQWHRTELGQLTRLLHLAGQLDAETRRIDQLRLPAPDWTDLAAVRRYADLVDAATAADALATAREPLRRIEAAAAASADWEDSHTAVADLHGAINRRDVNDYAAAYRRLHRLGEVRHQVADRDRLAQRLAAAAPALRRAVEQGWQESHWPQRLGQFAAAWQWAAAVAWLQERELDDINAIQADINDIDQRIRQQVETLAATRAWGHAVSPDRLTGQARSDLESYAYQVRKLGKGTGRYAAERKADIRQAMDRCRPAVPVWIMPIYRIAEQLEVRPNMFDVVIVDEASQAGLEAVFLQYLAPKIVVIGDDKQVSPAAVGVERQRLHDLARQHLADDRYRATWQDPDASLFDLAKMRFAGMLTLVEHRRCVPEIIGFSNQIAYEPEGIRLIPVRQFGADRLEPIKPVFVSDGDMRGTTNPINRPEAKAIVDQIEKCLSDPRYDGLTFGVISLQRKAQAQLIAKLLLDRVPPAEWKARNLRCGDSADFQGSERDVMFLSMVAAPGPDRRLAALTREMYVQRYNVAASRAKDQMWLFHSVQPSDLGNPDDMRFRLLEYCYARHGRNQETGAPQVNAVPHDRLVPPFDSLFEQRVYNRLVERDYTVWPQYEASGYRIDLVVVGARGMLAVECDGDAWHGPEHYQRDLARQRDLERCGWTFFRIRESAFYADQPAVLEKLWATLREHEIYPAGWLPEAIEAPAQPPAEATPAHPAEDDRDLNATPTVRPASQLLEAPRPQKVSSDLDTQRPSQVPGTDRGASAVNPLDRAAVPVATGSSSTLAAYGTYEGSAPPALESTRSQLVEGILAVVAAEGPVIGARLHAAYVKASSGYRVGKQVAHALNSAIVAAVRRGLLIEDNPLNEQGVKPRTYRLPDQPTVRLRQLGPRSLEEVPPRELAELMVRAATKHGWGNDERLYRAVLAWLGLKRLTPNVDKRLYGVSQLARSL